MASFTEQTHSIFKHATVYFQEPSKLPNHILAPRLRRRKAEYATRKHLKAEESQNSNHWPQAVPRIAFNW